MTHITTEGNSRNGRKRAFVEHLLESRMLPTRLLRLMCGIDH